MAQCGGPPGRILGAGLMLGADYDLLFCEPAGMPALPYTTVSMKDDGGGAP